MVRARVRERGTVIPYSSVKQALGAAAHLARPLDYPKPSNTRVQSIPDGDAQDRPVMVRAVLTSIGIEPDSDEALLLYDAATRSDEVGSQDLWDELAEQASTDREYREAVRRGAAARARLSTLIEIVGPALIEAGVVRKPPKLQRMAVGYRVVEDDTGRRDVQIVVDPHPGDPRVLLGSEGERQAWRIVRREVEDDDQLVVRQTVAVSTRKHPGLAAELGPAWERGDFGTLTELDAEIAERLDCSPQWARRVRASWGIEGSRGAAPTRPPGYDADHCATMHSGQGGRE